MKLLRYKRVWLFLLLPFSILLLHLASLAPNLVERVYSRFIYRYLLAGTIGRIISLVPFSMTECAAVGLVLFLAGYVIHLFRRRKNTPVYIHRKRGAPNLSKFISTLLAAAGVIYFAFAITCGFNYHRLTFAQQTGLDVRPSSTEELAALCTSLVDTANEIRPLLLEDESGVTRLSAPFPVLAKKAQEYYANAAGEYPVLSGFTALPKPAFASRGISYLQISGIYIPFLFEPNVNVDMVDHNIPVTMMHEMSHFKGYMREDEANFIAYLACKYSGDAEFIYSGTMLALVHSSNALYRSDRDLYWEVMGSLSEAAWADITANNQYWASFEGPVAEVSTSVNNAYLRSNKQESGVKSYGEMVDLLLAEYRKEHDA